VKDDKEQFNNYCLQQWTQYMERIGREQESPLSFKQYLNRYKKLLEEEYSERPED
jgi:hypothetical protein